MKYVSGIIAALNAAQIHVILLALGVVLVLLGTTRLKRIPVTVKGRVWLNGLGISLSAVSLFMIVVQVIPW